MAKTCDCCGTALNPFDTFTREISNPRVTLNLCENCAHSYDGLLKRTDKKQTIQAIHWGQNHLAAGTVNPLKSTAFVNILQMAEAYVNGQFLSCEICGKEVAQSQVTYSDYGNSHYTLCNSCCNHFIGLKGKPDSSDILWAKNAVNAGTISESKKEPFVRLYTNAQTRISSDTEKRDSIIRLSMMILYPLLGIMLGGWIAADLFDISILTGMIVGGCIGSAFSTLLTTVLQYCSAQEKRHQNLMMRLEELENQIKRE